MFGIKHQPQFQCNLQLKSVFFVSRMDEKPKTKKNTSSMKLKKTSHFFSEKNGDRSKYYPRNKCNSYLFSHIKNLNEHTHTQNTREVVAN